TVQFTDESTNAPTSWLWSFGDGNSSILQSPSFEYLSPGLYTVSLTATNTAGSDTNTKVSYINVTATAVAPVAEFSGSPTSGVAPLTVQFTDLSTNAPTFWIWLFGDGNSSTLQNPSFEYARPGLYTVALTATNTAGSDTSIKTNYINVTATAEVPVAEFSAAPSEGVAPLTVQFTDTSIGSPTSWFWSFGDGNSSSLQNPSFDYTSPGLYTVSLTVTNNAGSDTITKVGYIKVIVLPTDEGGSDDGDTGIMAVEQQGDASTSVNVGGDTAVSQVTVTGSGLTGLVVTGIILQNPSQTIPPSTGTVYQYIDLIPAQFQTISSAEILFDVPVSWLDEHDYNPDDIFIMSYINNQWQTLPTTLVRVTPDKVFYKVEIPKFAPIVIVGRPAQISLDAGQASQSSPMGFEGLSFNDDGTNTLNLDLDQAETIGAQVTIYFNRVEVYQHNSPGVLITFWGDQFDISQRNITGKVTKAEFVTDPLSANLTLGNVSGSVRADLSALTQTGILNTTISGNINQEIAEKFLTITLKHNLQLDGVAYTLDFRKYNITRTGAANVTMSIPQLWVNSYGGKETVRIIRIGEETGTTELLETVYTGIDQKGNMVFRGDSPNGSSLFGLITAKATTIEQEQNPNATIVPVSRPAMTTNVGMIGWLWTVFVDNPIIVFLIIGLLAGVAYFGWWKKRL
ncbi:MAG: PKD domain-containing protein, partial [Methanoregula sp.]|nr:PKD domain-containing protein [Methanoregula sp.]